MNDRMSYNDVEQLKRQIRARLGGAVNDMMNMAGGAAQGARQPFQGAPQMNRPMNRQGQPMNQQGIQQRIQRSNQKLNSWGMSQPMRSPNSQPQAMNSVMAQSPPPMQSSMAQQQMRSSMAPPPQMRSSMTPPPPMMAQDMTPQPMAGGAHFDRYNCGHDYPRMSMKQHIISELDADDMIKRTDNLRYAVVMAEVLGEPVSRRRRRKRNLAGQAD